MGLRYRKVTGTAIIRAEKPFRTMATIAQDPVGIFHEEKTLRLIGRFPKTGSYDDWYLADWYRGNGYGEGIVTSVDLRNIKLA